MYIQKAILSGRKRNRAIRRAKWLKGQYIYGGMDNLLYLRNGGFDRQFVWAIADLLAADYVTTKEADFCAKANPKIEAVPF